MKLRGLLIFMIFVCFCTVGFAQPGPNDPPGGNPFGVPLSGIEWLLVSGALLGLKKIHKNYKGRT
jgi:hypothetical protein